MIVIAAFNPLGQSPSTENVPTNQVPGETAAVADRVIVFVDGMLTQELHGDALTEHQLVAAMNTSANPMVRPAA